MEMHFTTSVISYFNANMVNRTYLRKDLFSGIQKHTEGDITLSVLCLYRSIPISIFSSIVLCDYMILLFTIFIINMKKIGSVMKKIILAITSLFKNMRSKTITDSSSCFLGKSHKNVRET